MLFLFPGMKDLTFNEDKKAAKVRRLFFSYTKLKEKNGNYASGFFSMEILNLANVCLQIFLTDLFLDGRFLNYGTRMAYYVRDYQIGGSDWNWSPMDEAFPKMSKCQFNKYGVGGGIQVKDKTFFSVLSLLLHRTTMPCAYCHSTLSTRRSTWCCGTGTSS